MAPPVPGLETFESSPSLSFLLEHPSGRKLVWDLGIRKDFHNYSKAIADYIPTTNYDIQVTKNVVDILEENGITGSEIEAVIWSHWHWDHIGDPASFPPSTDLIVGQGFSEAMLPGYPANPASPIRESDYSGRRLREIDFKGVDGVIRIGQFPAFDYFGDGSFYLLDSPGHASFRGRETSDTLYDMTFGHDIPLATKTMQQLQELDCAENVFVIIAHDSTVRDGVAHFPQSLNDWQAKGWGKQLKWAFLRDLEPYFRSKEL
ncbi:hypothetical protein LTR84_004454 [Exophiala bonariae]|uniref:Metallo-beta-lactamase domain-containing protein n=1 Tax=Exophiala bonariae TaxID=1690606 RepID=A0AAV9N4P2_9EURO|nr:hypothetical protein LTR84_004454 [Exophiala bonariae]